MDKRFWYFWNKLCREVINDFGKVGIAEVKGVEYNFRIHNVKQMCGLFDCIEYEIK